MNWRRGSFATLIGAGLLASPLSGASALVHVPPPGSAERQAILDGLRSKGDLKTRVFVVRWLKSGRGWAFVMTRPQSADGTQHYEDEAALLQARAGGWQVVDQPCGEEACDFGKELARIRRQHPAAPVPIFPAK